MRQFLSDFASKAKQKLYPKPHQKYKVVNPLYDNGDGGM